MPPWRCFCFLFPKRRPINLFERDRTTIVPEGPSTFRKTQRTWVRTLTSRSTRWVVYQRTCRVRKGHPCEQQPKTWGRGSLVQCRAETIRRGVGPCKLSEGWEGSHAGNDASSGGAAPAAACLSLAGTDGGGAEAEELERSPGRVGGQAAARSVPRMQVMDHFSSAINKATYSQHCLASI